MRIVPFKRCMVQANCSHRFSRALLRALETVRAHSNTTHDHTANNVHRTMRLSTVPLSLGDTHMLTYMLIHAIICSLSLLNVRIVQAICLHCFFVCTGPIQPPDEINVSFFFIYECRLFMRPRI